MGDRSLSELAPLPTQVTSLFAVTVTEFGIFSAVFLAVTRDHAFSWRLTYVFVAVFLAGLLEAGFQLMRLYAPHSKPEEGLPRYRRAWWAFFAGNAAVPVYFTLWWLHVTLRVL